MPHSAPGEIAAAIRRLARARVLVVGDAMLDRFVYGEVGRISPEAPVPVLTIEHELAVPGGAGNVVRNLAALGAAAAFVSVVGDDQAGSDLTGLIGGQPGVEPWLLVQGGRVTTLKTRFIARASAAGHGHHLLRADREEVGAVHPRLAERLLRIASDAMAAVSVVVLSDYRKGVLAEGAPARLIAAAHAAGRLIIADLQGPDVDRFAGADVAILPATSLEAERDGGIAAATALRARAGLGAVLLTSGERGMTLLHGPVGGAASMLHLPPEGSEPQDLSGGRDSMAAVLAAALATGATLPIAARIASLAAGIVAGKIGTAVARESDLRAAAAPQAGALRKIVPTDAVAERALRWRRAGATIGFTQGAFDPLRPGHVHLLEQARSACDRLVVGVASDAAVRRLRGEDRPTQPEAVRAARVASLPCADLVVILDHDEPADMLRTLRPELLATGADRAADDVAGAELVQQWGGRVMVAELLPEIPA